MHGGYCLDLDARIGEAVANCHACELGKLVLSWGSRAGVRQHVVRERWNILARVALAGQENWAFAKLWVL